ncbi:MAG TPA: hypothetical protein DDW49_09040 [Deltaproteobacteria bacterium]|nr:MAG: hypothetical protein A2048_11020 [Deltaproteobacteria bacterium GWA2_45_12]HBF13505.1 hypothetical protein [Deltaproteobacteria bacterium]
MKNFKNKLRLHIIATFFLLGFLIVSPFHVHLSRSDDVQHQKECSLCLNLKQQIATTAPEAPLPAFFTETTQINFVQAFVILDSFLLLPLKTGPPSLS